MFDLIKLFNLNLDPLKPIHYIIGVQVNKDTMAEGRGKLFLKYGPIVYTNEEVIEYQIAIKQSQMEFPKINLEQALKNCKLSPLIVEFDMMRQSCRANDATMHHFCTDFALMDEDLINFVDAANFSKDTFRKLKDSEIK